MPALPTYTAARYVQPLREGGSLPAVVDTEGGGLFVVKFRGAGQGAKVLVAEVIVGLLAQALGFRVPDVAAVCVLDRFGRTEPDPEIQDLLKASHGVNVGLRYLDGAFNFDALAARDLVTPEFAARLVWFDALLTNPDRTHRNPNLLVWQGAPWLIDHGAALYAHHDWASADEARTRTPFPLVKDHVLLGASGDLEAADAELAPQLTAALLDDVLAQVPDALLTDPVSGSGFPTAADARARYRAYLTTRLAAPRPFLAEAIAARERLRRQPAAGPPSLRPPMSAASTSSSAGDRIAYDFATLRVVPHVHLADFVTVGVVVHARTAGYLRMRVLTDPAALGARVRDLDPHLLSRYLRSWEATCAGDPAAGPVALAPPSERFHWITAPRSDVLQSSPVHEGVCDDPERALAELFAAHVRSLADER